MRATKLPVSTAIIALLLGAGATAGVPSSVVYQGTLFQQGAAASGSYSIRVQLFSALTGGASLGQVVSSVTVVNGAFSLDVGTLFPNASGNVFLEVDVKGPNDSDYDALPRVQVSSVPFALHAGTADSVDWANVINAPTPLQGATGATGAMGEPGLQGAQGPQGIPGLQGIQGIPGLLGPAGLQGAMGLQGAQGIQGIPGLVGPTGAQGLVGPTGAQGIQGVTGAMGATGAQGIQGAQGAPIAYQGDWNNENVYNLGDAIFYLGSSYISTVPMNSNNTPGESPAWELLAQQGAVGATGAQGIPGPAINWAGIWGFETIYNVGDAVSRNGSSYISLINDNGGLEPENDSTAWGLLARAGSDGNDGATGSVGATGAAGATGSTGAQGIQGIQGVTGAIGPTGAQGIQGLQGITGAIGPTGVPGATGATGAMGATGAAGAPGATGVTGAQGATGLAGAVGATGVTGATGAVGATGPTGAAGATGATGVGTTGATGATGATGTASGLQLRDSASHVLGTIVSVNYATGSFTVLSSTGYFVTIRADGTYLDDGLGFSGNSCSGAAYAHPTYGDAYSALTGNPLFPSVLTKKVFYSAANGTLYVPTGGSNGIAPAGSGSFGSVYENGACLGEGGSGIAIWPLQTITSAALGMPATITAPLTYP